MSIITFLFWDIKGIISHEERILMSKVHYQYATILAVVSVAGLCALIWGLSEYDKNLSLQSQIQTKTHAEMAQAASDVKKLQTASLEAQIFATKTDFQQSLPVLLQHSSQVQNDFERLSPYQSWVGDQLPTVKKMNETISVWMKNQSNPSRNDTESTLTDWELKTDNWYNKLEKSTDTPVFKANLIDSYFAKPVNNAFNHLRNLYQNRVAVKNQPIQADIEKMDNHDEVAKQRIQQFFSTRSVSKVTPVFHQSGVNGVITTYTAEIDGQPAYIIFNSSQEIIGFSKENLPVGKISLTLEQAKEKAISFLKHLSPGIYTEVHAQQLGKIGYLTYSPVQSQKTVLGETITVKVNLTDGQIWGFVNHSNNQHVKMSEGPIPFMDTQTKFNPSFHVKMTTPVVIKNTENHWISGIAVYGTLHGHTFRVIIDSRNQKVLDIQHLS